MTHLNLNLNLNSSILLSIFVVISWTIFSPCHADNYGVPEGLLTEVENTTNSSVMATLFQNANSTLENNSTLSTANSSMVPLAAERTRRIDPSTDDFSYYEAGWDITNGHYIESVAFSGTPLFVTGALWCFTVGICFTIIVCCYCCGCCKNKPRTDYSRKAYAISLIFLSLFLIMTIIGGILLYTGQSKFLSTASDVSNNLVTKANTIADVVHDVLSNLAAAKNIKVGQFDLPDDIKKNIGKIERLSNQTAYVYIKRQSEETAESSTQFLNAISHSLVTVTTLMLILAVVGFIISVLGWKLVVYILLFIGWILVTNTFMLSGISFIVQNGVADTCVAMEEWLQHPQDQTALSKLLPCMDKAAAKRTLDMTRNTSFHMVNLVNAFVINVANNANVPPYLQDAYYNQSGPFMPLLCNPLFPDLTERTCDPVEVVSKDAPKAYQSFICNTSPSGLCITTGRLTPSLYTNVMMATNLSDTLNQHGPFLAQLVDCSFVVETFAQISKKDCPLLRRYSSQVFIGLVLVSVAVMFSVILWVVFVRERRFQMSSKKLSRTNVEVQ